MSPIVDVACPFTGQTDLIQPTWEYVLQVPGQNVWYFPYDDDTEIVAECVGHAMGITEGIEGVKEAMAILIEQGNMVRVGDWYFVLLPEVPVFRHVTAAELIVAKHRGLPGQVQLLDDVKRHMGDYLHDIACAWAAST